MSLVRQLILLSTAILVMAILAVSLLLSDLFSRSYHEQIKAYSHGLHSVLAESLARAVIDGQPLTVRALLRDNVANEPSIAYIYVTHFDGSLFAHSFDQGLPRSLLQTLVINDAREESRHFRFRTDTGGIDHFSAPLIQGMPARLYLGINDAHLRETLSKLRQRTIGVTVAIILLGVLFSVIMARRISAPVSRLSKLLTRYGKGEAIAEDMVNIGGPLEIQGLGTAAETMIKEREQLRVSLQEREVWLHNLFENTPVGLALARLDGQLIEINPAYASIIGFSVEETLKLGYWDITPEEYANQEEVQLEKIKQTGRYGPYEKTYVHKNGNRVPVRLSGQIVERDGEPYIWSVVEDISLLRRAESLERRLRDLFEHAHDEIYVFDGASLKFLQVSHGALVNLGYTQDEIQGMTPVDIEPEFNDEEFAALVAPLRAGEVGSLQFETYHRRKNYSNYPVEVRLQYSEDAEGAVFFAIALDLTERKEVEAAMIEHSEQLERKVEERTAQLQASNKELESFAHSVSHDLRAPLRAIDGFSLALKEDYAQQLDTTAQDYVNRVRAATQRMGQLIDDMLQLSRVSRGELEIQSVDLGALARSVMDELQDGEPERKFEFVLGQDLRVKADSRLMRSMLDNLLGNAWKYTAREPVSRIVFDRSVEQPGVFYIQDNGVGFDMQHASKLFGAFQRLHRSDDFPGTGVGLATVQRIMHRHGGRIWAKAVKGEGATFYFTLGEEVASPGAH